MKNIKSHSALRCITGGFLVIVLINAYVFPHFPGWLGFHSTGNTVFDLQFGFDKAFASDLLERFGPSGRNVYLKSIWLVDMPYALFYGWFYTCLFRLMTKNKTLIYLPLLISFFDVAENIAFTFLVRQYPHLNDLTVEVASFFNRAKWIFALITLLSFLYLLFGILIKKTRNKRN